MSNKARRYSLFPKSLDECIEPVLRPVLKSQGLAGSRLLVRWPEIVGQRLARYSIPEKIHFPAGKRTDGTLTIAVENGFALEIQHLQPIILERLATYFGYKAITRIAISASLPASESEEIVNIPQPATLALDPNLAEPIEDEDLKSAFSSFAKTLSGK